MLTNDPTADTTTALDACREAWPDMPWKDCGHSIQARRADGLVACVQPDRVGRFGALLSYDTGGLSPVRAELAYVDRGTAADAVTALRAASDGWRDLAAAKFRDALRALAGAGGAA
jgi:hypothetical protein